MSPDPDRLQTQVVLGDALGLSGAVTQLGRYAFCGPPAFPPAVIQGLNSAECLWLAFGFRSDQFAGFPPARDFHAEPGGHYLEAKEHRSDQERTSNPVDAQP